MRGKINQKHTENQPLILSACKGLYWYMNKFRWLMEAILWWLLL